MVLVGINNLYLSMIVGGNKTLSFLDVLRKVKERISVSLRVLLNEGFTSRL